MTEFDSGSASCYDHGNDPAVPVKCGEHLLTACRALSFPRTLPPGFLKIPKYVLTWCGSVVSCLHVCGSWYYSIYYNCGDQDRPIQKFVNFPVTFIISQGDCCDKDGQTVIHFEYNAINPLHTPLLLMNRPEAGPRREDWNVLNWSLYHNSAHRP